MIFSLFDIKAEVFGPLFEARTFDEAKRLFISVLLNDGSSNVNRYPQDHQLYSLGDFDNVTGVLDVTSPNMIMTGFEACQLCNKYKDDMNKLFTDSVVVPFDKKKKKNVKKKEVKNVNFNENSDSVSNTESD